VLAVLEASDHPCLTVPGLARATGLSGRRVRDVVGTLERHSLVYVERGCIGWRGAGKYAKLVNRRDYHGDVPTAETYQLRREYGGHVYEGDVKLVRTGMPVYGLWVWLPARREQWEADNRRAAAETISLLAAAGRPGHAPMGD
jgi:hypothetical protein